MNEVTVDRDALIAWVVQRSSWTKPAAAVMFGLNLEVAPDQERAAPITMRPFQVAKNASPADRESEARDLVEEFVREAEGCTATMARPQRFSISAHHKEDPAVMPMARTFFVVKPSGDFSTPADQDPRDVVGNLQRALSDMTRAYGTNMQANNDRMADENRDLRLNARALERALLDAVRASEKAMSEALTRQITAKEADMMIAVKRQAFDTTMMWLGQHLSKAAEQPKMPIVMADLVDLVATLTGPQRETFVKMLPAIKAALTPEEREQFARALKGFQAQANGAARAGGDPS